MSNVQRLLTILAGLLVATSVFAHGEPIAKRGGILQQVDDLAFELVVRADKIDLFVYDGPEDVSSEGMSGVLTIISGDDKTKASMQPTGINRLRATDVTAASGSRVVAIITLADGKSLAVQFAVP